MSVNVGGSRVDLLQTLIVFMIAASLNGFGDHLPPLNQGY